jgi:molecular chaperone DnaJ
LREVDSRRTGDLYVRVVVRTPDELSKEQKTLLKQLAELRGESLDILDSQTVRRTKPAGPQAGS